MRCLLLVRAALLAVAILSLSAMSNSLAADGKSIFPGETWETKKPAEVGLNADELDESAKAVGGEGVVIRDGYLVKTWGQLELRADWASLIVRAQPRAKPADVAGGSVTSRRLSPGSSEQRRLQLASTTRDGIGVSGRICRRPTPGRRIRRNWTT